MWGVWCIIIVIVIWLFDVDDYVWCFEDCGCSGVVCEVKMIDVVVGDDCDDFCVVCGFDYDFWIDCVFCDWCDGVCYVVVCWYFVVVYIDYYDDWWCFDECECFCVGCEV